MARRQTYTLCAVGVLLSVVGFTWGRTTGDNERPAQPTDFSDLWQWDLTRVSPPDGQSGLRLLLRTKHYDRSVPAPVPLTAPLRLRDGEDRLLAEDLIPEGVPDDGRLTLQLLDLRQIGVAVLEPDAPLRFQGVLRMYGSRMKVAAKVSGHSVRGRPIVHAGGWVNGERPLMSFSTAGLAGHDEYTFLLSNRPVFE